MIGPLWPKLSQASNNRQTGINRQASIDQRILDPEVLLGHYERADIGAGVTETTTEELPNMASLEIDMKTTGNLQYGPGEASRPLTEPREGGEETLQLLDDD